MSKEGLTAGDLMKITGAISGLIVALAIVVSWIFGLGTSSAETKKDVENLKKKADTHEEQIQELKDKLTKQGKDIEYIKQAVDELRGKK